MNNPVIFNKKIRKIHLKRAVKLIPDHDALLQETTNRLIERINEDINYNFSDVLELGSRLSNNLQTSEDKKVCATNICSEFLKGSHAKYKVCCDEECLPFKNNSFDLVLSCLNLHWVNNFPEFLLQIRNILREKGLFIASLLGGSTLSELRTVLTEVDLSNKGGIAPRLSPSVSIKDAGLLMQGAGFSLPVVDADTITLLYKNATLLFRDLRGMGETNSLLQKPSFAATKTYMNKVEETYKEMFCDKDGLIPATFEVITLTGWKS